MPRCTSRQARRMGGRLPGAQWGWSHGGGAMGVEPQRGETAQVLWLTAAQTAERTCGVCLQGPDHACTVGGLRPGCSYMVRVSAVSQAGTGGVSSAPILQTAPSTPGTAGACTYLWVFLVVEQLLHQSGWGLPPPPCTLLPTARPAQQHYPHTWLAADCPRAPFATARQQTELTVSWAAPEHDGECALTSKHCKSALNSLPHLPALVLLLGECRRQPYRCLSPGDVLPG